jgi:hypothetical protein
MDEMWLEPLNIVVVPVERIHALARRTVVVRLRHQPLDGGALPRLLHLTILPLTHLSTVRKYLTRKEVFKKAVLRIRDVYLGSRIQHIARRAGGKNFFCPTKPFFVATNIIKNKFNR